MLKQEFTGRNGSIVRRVEAGSLTAESTIEITTESTIPLAHQWWTRQLRGEEVRSEFNGSLAVLDLFSGVGGLSAGAAMAVEAVGMRYSPLAAVDTDVEALKIYKANYPTASTYSINIASAVDYHVYGRGTNARFAYDPVLIEPSLETYRDRIDLLLAGPPCQGHSNLNNHTRRSDPRNMLYLCAVAIGVALRAQMIVIENVADVLADKTEVVPSSLSLLMAAGYSVSHAVLSATDLGGAQTRKRHFLIATREPHLPLAKAALLLRQPPMSLRAAIGDLVNVQEPTFMDEVPVLSSENQERIEYLFKKDIFELPDKVRPNCHKNGHTYPSVYGRLHWDKPAQTITTGFMTPGRGRYIHPSERRVITPREAARIQGFPDKFAFTTSDGVSPSKKALTKWIGDAVPTWLGYSAVLAGLSSY